ncbi:MAG: GNAT family N-acetyltransferase, partial [Rhodospirillales bacterium]|nr:GNAT family N-acetyltransferase [Rhodospirillales bacterium]
MSRLVATTPVHAQVLAALHRPCFDDFWDAAAFAEILAMPGTYGWVAFDDDPAGLVVCRIVADEAEILTIAVLPERRG